MVKAANEKDAIARTEAALYSSGRPLKIDEIIRASGTESRIKTKQILDDLVKKTKSAFKAIEIAILTRWFIRFLCLASNLSCD